MAIQSHGTAFCCVIAAGAKTAGWNIDIITLYNFWSTDYRACDARSETDVLHVGWIVATCHRQTSITPARSGSLKDYASSSPEL